jgi:pyruvate formate lyase activating enzyme
MLESLENTDQYLRVHSVETFGTHDGPGIRLVIFVQGCQFRCLYCANPDTLPIKGGELVSLEEIVQTVEKQRTYFGSQGGITISGGEPLLQLLERTDLLLLDVKHIDDEHHRKLTSIPNDKVLEVGAYRNLLDCRCGFVMYWYLVGRISPNTCMVSVSISNIIGL